MAIITGTMFNDVYTGTKGILDLAVIDSYLYQSTFFFDGTNWLVTSTAGVDTLSSIESIQFNDSKIEATSFGGETRVNSSTMYDQNYAASTSLSNGVLTQ